MILAYKNPFPEFKKIPASPAGNFLDAGAAPGCPDDKKDTYTLFDIVVRAICHNPKTRSALAIAQAARVMPAQKADLLGSTAVAP